jgi:hypothetical protein
MDPVVTSAIVAGSITLVLKTMDVIVNRIRSNGEEKVYEGKFILAEAQASEADARRVDIWLKRTDEWATKMETRNAQLSAKVEELSRENIAYRENLSQQSMAIRQMQSDISECVADRELLLEVVSTNNLRVPNDMKSVVSRHKKQHPDHPPSTLADDIPPDTNGG